MSHDAPIELLLYSVPADAASVGASPSNFSSTKPRREGLIRNAILPMQLLPPPEIELAHLCKVFSAYRYNFQDENTLQEGMAVALARNAIAFEREVRLDAKNRPDFMVGAVAIEVKIKGTFAQFLRQAHRYLALEQISALIVVGTPKWMPAVPNTLLGKPVYTVRLMSSLL